MTKSASWSLQEVQSSCKSISMADLGISEESARKWSSSLKRRNLRCSEEAADYIADAPPILAGYGGLHSIGSHATALHWFVFFNPTRTNQRAVILHD